ncbi:24471_t:CDS:2, partial [Racocetra persica]
KVANASEVNNQAPWKHKRSRRNNEPTYLKDDGVNYGKKNRIVSMMNKENISREGEYVPDIRIMNEDPK